MAYHNRSVTCIGAKSLIASYVSNIFKSIRNLTELVQFVPHSEAPYVTLFYSPQR